MQTNIVQCFFFGVFFYSFRLCEHYGTGSTAGKEKNTGLNWSGKGGGVG